MHRTLCATALSALLSPAAFACDSWTTGDLTVTEAWSRATIGADRPAAFYIEISNVGAEPDALVAIATPIAGMPMLHETVVKDGIASMPHGMSVPVPAGETVRLAPGGFHGMLMDLNEPLKEGDRFPLTLTFERAGAVTVDVEVVSFRADRPACADGS